MVTALPDDVEPDDDPEDVPVLPDAPPDDDPPDALDDPEDVLVPAETSDPTEIGSAVTTPSIGRRDDRILGVGDRVVVRRLATS